METDISQLVPLGVIANRLRVPVSWLRTEAEAGRIPHLRAGRAILFDVDTVIAILIQRAREVPTRPGVTCAK